MSEHPLELNPLFGTLGFNEHEAVRASTRYLGSFSAESFELADSPNIEAIRRELLRDAISATRELIERATAHRDALIDQAMESSTLSDREIARLSTLDTRRVAAKRRALAEESESDRDQRLHGYDEEIFYSHLEAEGPDVVPSEWGTYRLSQFARTPDEALDGLTPIQWVASGHPLETIVELMHDESRERT